MNNKDDVILFDTYVERNFCCFTSITQNEWAVNNFVLSGQFMTFVFNDRIHFNIIIDL